MYVRLAFAVAAHLEPEILIVDEVLAVGDAAFQKKCLGKMNDVAHGGRTVLFVSHNMGADQLPLHAARSRIDKGTIREEGATQDVVVPHYLDSVRDGFIVGSAKPEDKLVIDRVVLKNARRGDHDDLQGRRRDIRRGSLHRTSADPEPTFHRRRHGSLRGVCSPRR